MPDTAGVVSLTLRLAGNIKNEIRSMAAEAQAQASSVFAGTGKAAAAAVSEPVKKAGGGIAAAIRQQCVEAAAGYAALGKMAAAALSKAGQPKAEPVHDGPWRVAAGGVALLNQKLDITGTKMREQQDKLAVLQQRFTELSKAGGKQAALEELDSQINAAQGHIVSLQEEMNRLNDKINRSSDQSSKAVKRTQGGVAALRKAAGTVGTAFQKAAPAAGKALQGIQRQAGGLAKSVRSAFKSAFLMAGLYAAARGIKSLMSDAAKQNMQFAHTLAAIKTNLTAAFVPVVQTVMPYIQTLMAGIAGLSARLAAASAQMFGSTVSKATAAAKKLQAVGKSTGNTSGIDQLNVIDSTRGDPVKAAVASGKQVTASMSELAGKIGLFIALLAGKVAAAAPAFIVGLSAVLGALLRGINGSFPDLQAAGIQLMQSLLSGAWSILPQVGPLAVHIVTLLLTAFLTYAPQLITMGVVLLQDFLSGMAAQLPAIIQLGVSALLSLIQGITQMLPSLIPTAVAIVLQLIGGLVEQLPALVQAAMDLCVALIQGILQSLPLILEQGVQIVVQLIAGIANSIGMIIDAAIAIILALVDYIIANPGQLINAGMQITVALGTGLLQATGQLVAGVGKLIAELVKKIFTTDWVAVGKRILSSIWDGIRSAAKTVGNLFGKLFGGGTSDTVTVPKFAAGGIISGPTLGLMGEYSGARSDPEVVAPLSHLQGMLGASDGTSTGMLAQILQLLQRLEMLLSTADLREVLTVLRSIDRWLEQQELDVRLIADDREIARSNRRGEKLLGITIAR